MARYSMCMNIGRLQYCQDINSSNLIYIVNAILVKIPAHFVVEIDKVILKFTWKYKECM